MSPAEVTAAVAAHLAGAGYAVLAEVDSPPSLHQGRTVRRRIDLLAVAPGPHLVAVEVKTTRQDYVAELTNPAKQDPWRAAAHQHMFAAPAGVIDPATLPAGSGLLVVDATEDGGVTFEVAVPAPVNPAPVDPSWLLHPVASRAAGAEAVILHRWATSGVPVVDLRAQVTHLEAELARTTRRAERAQDKVTAWRALAARQGHKVPCATCGAPVVPVRFSAGAFTTWRHAQPHLAGDCPASTTGVRPRDEDL